jgi:HEAT repeat protein
MPPDIKDRVMQVLTAIEISSDAASRIQSWGNEAVTVLCEAALGSYPNLRSKVRANAAALVGRMDHPQAVETIPLLIADPNPAVAIRAIRAAGRRKNEQVVERLGQILADPDSPALVVAEAVSSLATIDSPEARARLDAFEAASPRTNRHRGDPAIERVLRSRRKR